MPVYEKLELEIDKFCMGDGKEEDWCHDYGPQPTTQCMKVKRGRCRLVSGTYSIEVATEKCGGLGFTYFRYVKDFDNGAEEWKSGTGNFATGNVECD